MGAGYRPEPEYDFDPGDCTPDCRVLWNRKVKATRKPWVCSVCGREHPAGTPKDDSATILDGEFQRVQQCSGMRCIFPNGPANGQSATDSLGNPISEDSPF